MKVMILAAGRGKRMRELTDNQPKPLIQLGQYALIEWQIIKLQQSGFKDFVINLGYKGQMIKKKLGDGSQYGIHIDYSIEPEQGLETGGGVFKALPLLGENPFLLTNADIFTDFPYHTLFNMTCNAAHLVLVPIPIFKSTGDFGIQTINTPNSQQSSSINHHQSIHYASLEKEYTFSGISIINPCIFKKQKAGAYPIAPLFKQEIQKHHVTAQLYRGKWSDIGTPDRLQEAEKNQIKLS